MGRANPIIVLGVLTAVLVNTAHAAEDSVSLFDRLHNWRFSLHRSFEGPDKGEPAQFGYMKAEGKDAEYTADFCVDHYLFRQSAKVLGAYLQPMVAVEGHLSSANDTAGDAWVLRGGLEFNWSDREGIGLYLYQNMALEANRGFTTDYLLYEILATPTARCLAMGKAYPVAKFGPDGKASSHPPVQFIWRPFIGFAAGGRIKGEITSREEDALIRLRPRVTAKLLLNFLNTMLGFKDIYLYGDGLYDLLPYEDESEHFYFETGAIFKFNENFSLICSYTRGERAPEYAEQNRFAATLGVVF